MRTPETRYAKGRDGCVAYQMIGDGPLDLVFIPDWVTNVDVMWEGRRWHVFSGACPRSAG